MSQKTSGSAALLADSEQIAFRALGFIADRPALLRHFLASNGLTEAELLRLPIRREHFAAVLGFLARNTDLMLDFSQQAKLSIAEVEGAWNDLCRLISEQ